MGIEWFNGSVHPLIVLLTSAVTKQSGGDETFLGVARPISTTQKSRYAISDQNPGFQLFRTPVFPTTSVRDAWSMVDWAMRCPNQNPG